MLKTSQSEANLLASVWLELGSVLTATYARGPSGCLLSFGPYFWVTYVYSLCQKKKKLNFVVVN